MAPRIFADGTRLVFEKGQIDNYLVTLRYPDGRHYSPTDSDFFAFFLTYSDKLALWESLVQLSIPLHPSLSLNEMSIPSLLGTAEEEQMLAAYAATLIAEENKVMPDGKLSRLGKRIKLVGAYQVLILGMSPQEAASWSRGRRWREIAAWAQAHNIP